MGATLVGSGHRRGNDEATTIGDPLSTLRALAAAVVAAGLIAACSGPGEPARTTGPAPGPGVLLDGSYRLDFDAAQQLAGGEPEPYAPFSRSFAFRSTCRATGCIATGSRVSDDDPGLLADPAFAVVLDYVHGEWETTFATQEPCHGHDTPVLVSWSLRPGDDDTLAGTRVESSTTPGCAYNTQMPVTVTRIGAVESAVTVADPAAEPPLRPSTPAYLTGQYSGRVSNPTTGATQTRPVAIRSACVRNTTQCRMLKTATRNNGARSVQAFHFAHGRWSTDLHEESKCSDGSTGDANSHWEYLMPPHPEDPIAKVIGTQHQVSTGACATSTDFDLTLTRTGD